MEPSSQADDQLEPTPASSPASPSASGKEQKIIQLHITSKQDLYAAFMPFIRDGGLFIPTNQSFILGDDVFLMLKLLQEPQKYTIPGKVVWSTPLGAQSGLRAGIGVQFIGDDARDIRKKISTHLAGFANSDLRTDTM